MSCALQWKMQKMISEGDVVCDEQSALPLCVPLSSAHTRYHRRNRTSLTLHQIETCGDRLKKARKVPFVSYLKAKKHCKSREGKHIHERFCYERRAPCSRRLGIFGNADQTSMPFNHKKQNRTPVTFSLIDMPFARRTWCHLCMLGEASGIEPTLDVVG